MGLDIVRFLEGILELDGIYSENGDFWFGGNFDWR